MELWIRSQNKEGLLLVDNICCIGNRVVFISNSKNGRVTIGTYSTEQRALEVLDEIQNAILCSSTSPEELKELKIEFKSWYATNIKTGVAIYQMPEE